MPNLYKRVGNTVHRSTDGGKTYTVFRKYNSPAEASAGVGQLMAKDRKTSKPKK